MGLGGEVGLDEGGVLEALSKPLYTRVWTEYVYGTKGASKGKIVEEIKHEASFSLATVLGVAGFAALLRLLQTIPERDVLSSIKDIVDDPAAIPGAIEDVLGVPDADFMAYPPGNLWDLWFGGGIRWAFSWRNAAHWERAAYREAWGKGPTWQPPGLYDPASTEH